MASRSGSSSRIWRRVIAALPRSYRTIVIDHRSWSEFDRPPRGYGSGDLVDNAEGVVAALALKRCTLIGHSTGGKVAMGCST